MWSSASMMTLRHLGRARSRCTRSAPDRRRTGRCRSSRRAAPGRPPGRASPSCRRRRRPDRRRGRASVTAIFERAPGSRARRLDAHDPLVDLGDLLLEQLLEQALVRARQDDLRAARVCDRCRRRRRRCGRRGGSVSRGTCSRNGRIGLGACPRSTMSVAALEAADDAGDELALAVLVLVEDVVALGVADALDDDLLGGLRGDAAEALRRVSCRSRRSPNFSSCSARLALVVLGRRRSGTAARRRSRPRGRPCGASATAISRPSSASSSSTTVDELEEVDLAGLLVELRLQLAVQPERAAWRPSGWPARAS